MKTTPYVYMSIVAKSAVAKNTRYSAPVSTISNGLGSPLTHTGS